MFAELFSVDICTLRESVGNEFRYIYTQKSTLPQTKTISAPFAPHQKLKDPHLALFVCALVAVDLIILFIYTLVEGVRGGLEPMMVPNTENPSEIQGVSMMQTISYQIQTHEVKLNKVSI